VSDKIDKVVLEYIKKGDTILFLGAGFSLLPIEFYPNRDRKGLKGALIEDFGGTLKDIPYNIEEMAVEDIVCYLEAERGTTREMIAGTIRNFLATAEELKRHKSFSLLHNLLIIYPNLFEAIITTNWDHGLEETLRDISTKDRKPLIKTLIKDIDCLKYDSSNISILKIHGDIEVPETLVLSSQDFDLYEKEHPRITERLRILFSTKFVILIGYSVKDENFRRIYRSLAHDLGKGLRGGWIISPVLGDHEKLWAPKVGLRHIPVEAQEFLSSVLSYIAKVPLGTSKVFKPKKEMHQICIEKDSELKNLATCIKKKYELRDVWVARLKESERPNRGIGQVAAYYVEHYCRPARTIALSTGETMESFVDSIDTSVFRERLTILSTIVLRIGYREYKSPLHLVQTFVSRFRKKRAEYAALQLPDDDYIKEIFSTGTNKIPELSQSIRTIGEAYIGKALESDVIISSLRPFDWYGQKNAPEDFPDQEDIPDHSRTIPIQKVSKLPIKKINVLFRKTGVTCIYTMIPLDKEGNDVLEKKDKDAKELSKALNPYICRPKISQLKSAAASKRKVICVAAHPKKLNSLKSVLERKLCNTLIIDETLAEALLSQ
jgi:hypothetical protein